MTATTTETTDQSVIDNPEPQEHPVDETQSCIATLQRERDELSARLDAAERARNIESLLHRAGALDPDAASSAAIQLAESEGLEPAQAVARLKRDRPGLFAKASPGPNAMPGAPAQAELDEQASAARATGDRRDVLRYMRLRRSA